MDANHNQTHVHPLTEPRWKKRANETRKGSLHRTVGLDGQQLPIGMVCGDHEGRNHNEKSVTILMKCQYLPTRRVLGSSCFLLVALCFSLHSSFSAFLSVHSDTLRTCTFLACPKGATVVVGRTVMSEPSVSPRVTVGCCRCCCCRSRRSRTLS